MPTPTDTDHRVEQCLISPPEKGCVEETGVEDTLVLPPGLCHILLSVEAATKIKSLLDGTTHPTYAGREMPTADASVLLKKID